MMQTKQIVLDRQEARQLFRKYREHRHYSEPVDLETQKTYQAISRGQVVVKALKSIVTAGAGEDGFPRLAICRADAEGGRIGPVDVLEQLHRRLPAGDRLRRVDQRAQRLVLEFLRCHRDRAVALLAGDREHRGEEAQVELADGWHVEPSDRGNE